MFNVNKLLKENAGIWVQDTASWCLRTKKKSIKNVNTIVRDPTGLKPVVCLYIFPYLFVKTGIFLLSFCKIHLEYLKCNNKKYIILLTIYGINIVRL